MTTTTVGSTILEVSDWMPGTSCPVREGVYERHHADGPFSCWNGRTWNRDAESPEAAAGQRAPSPDQHVAWRGLAAASDRPCATCRGHGVVDRGYDDEAARDLIGECPDC